MNRLRNTLGNHSLWLLLTEKKVYKTHSSLILQWNLSPTEVHILYIFFPHLQDNIDIRITIHRTSCKWLWHASLFTWQSLLFFHLKSLSLFFPHIFSQHPSQRRATETTIYISLIHLYLPIPLSFFQTHRTLLQNSIDEDVRLNTRLLLNTLTFSSLSSSKNRIPSRLLNNFARIIVPECLPSKVFIYQVYLPDRKERKWKRERQRVND